MMIAHKIALDPTATQAQYFARACGIARFAWNWALAEWQRQYAARKDDPTLPAPSEAALRRQLNAIKRDDFPWMLEVTKAAPQQAIRNLGVAFKRYFDKKAKYPRFKKKGDHDSFRAENGPETFACTGRRLKLPIVGWVRMREGLRFSGQVKSVTVSRVADRWYASVIVEITHHVPERENQAIGGVDLGVKALATLSDGTVFEGPKALRFYLARLKRLSRRLSAKVKGSKNRAKAQAKLARLHARIANIRRDGLHKLTTELVRRFSVLGIEDLNVKGMMANHCLARAVADMGFHEFRRQLEYKAAMCGTQIVVADRWYPSSKTCADCGHVLEVLPLSEREWTCPVCGIVHDRDHNAAINLENLAASLQLRAVSPPLAASSAVTACGEESSDRHFAVPVKLASMKQELNGTLPGYG